ncbi:MAG: GT2 family glycosyltransferase, partial [Saprospiraceae bacterium]
AHMEEIDLCWRIHRAGHEIYCIPESKIYHLGGGTLKKLNPQKTYLNFRNNLIMILKNNRRKYFYLTILLKLIFDGIAGVKFLLEGSPLHTWSVVKAHFYVYGHIGAILKKRRDLKKVFPKTIIHPVYSKSIVISHYLLGKKTFKELKFNTGK